MDDDVVPIACTLSAGELPDRLARWRTLVDDAVVSRHAIDGGVRLGLAPEVDAGEVASLAAAEQECCAFFTFRLCIEPDGTSLEVTAPDDALEIVHALVGQPS